MHLLSRWQTDRRCGCWPNWRICPSCSVLLCELLHLLWPALLLLRLFVTRKIPSRRPQMRYPAVWKCCCLQYKHCLPRLQYRNMSISHQVSLDVTPWKRIPPPLKKSDLHSLDFVMNRFWYYEIIQYQWYEYARRLLAKRTNKFESSRKIRH